MSSRTAQSVHSYLKALYFIPQSIVFIVSSVPFASIVSILPHPPPLDYDRRGGTSPLADTR